MFVNLKMMFALVVVEQAIKFEIGLNLDQIKEIKLFNNLKQKLLTKFIASPRFFYVAKFWG